MSPLERGGFFIYCEDLGCCFLLLVSNLLPLYMQVKGVKLNPPTGTCCRGEQNCSLIELFLGQMQRQGALPGPAQRLYVRGFMWLYEEHGSIEACVMQQGMGAWGYSEGTIHIYCQIRVKMGAAATKQQQRQPLMKPNKAGGWSSMQRRACLVGKGAVPAHNRVGVGGRWWGVVCRPLKFWLCRW